MRRSPVRPLPLLALVVSVACGGDRAPPAAPTLPPWTPEPPARIPDVGRDTGAALRTAGVRYRLRRTTAGLAVDLPFSFQNDGDAVVYVTACRGARGPVPMIALEKEVEPGKWVHAWDPPPDPACDTVPLVVAPGERFADTLHVLGTTTGGGAVPEFTAPPPEGVYRLAWDALAAFDKALPWLGPGLPARWRLSNRFVLDPPE